LERAVVEADGIANWSKFTATERELIRLELMPRFGQDSDLANGLFLRTWRAGPEKGQPKVPKAIQTMLDRGLVRIGTNPMGRPAAFFTKAGVDGLRQLLQDRRVMDHERSTICGEHSGSVIRRRMKDEIGRTRGRHPRPAWPLRRVWEGAPRDRGQNSRASVGA
jgi:hypothetical protein